MSAFVSGAKVGAREGVPLLRRTADQAPPSDEGHISQTFCSNILRRLGKASIAGVFSGALTQIYMLALFICCLLGAIAVWHVYLAFALTGEESGAVPSVDGKPVFVPSRRMTFLVAAALLLFASLVAAMAGSITVNVRGELLVGASYALAAGMFARAVGDLEYVGFFKRVRGTKFATLDTFLYSPVCLLLAVAVAALAAGRDK